MSPLDRDPRVLEIARRLALPDGHGVVSSILSFCRQRVEGWVRQAGGVGSMDELEALACSRLDLQFEEFGDEGKLDAIVRKHVDAGDVVFATLPTLFDPETFATLIRCRPARPDAGPRHVAVIDGRGDKARRRWFSRWHEIAHLLTLDAPGEAQTVHRSTTPHSATERLMDLIAADVGFFEPLFAPVFAEEVLACGRLDFAAIERVRRRHAPEASLQATSIACLKRWPRPAVYLEAGLALTAAEARHFDREPVPARRPTPKLRVMKVAGNDPARESGLGLIRHMRVPETSVLHRVFFARAPVAEDQGISSAEDLSQWCRSNGQRLPGCPLQVEARARRHRLEALVQSRP